MPSVAQYLIRLLLGRPLELASRKVRERCGPRAYLTEPLEPTSRERCGCSESLQSPENGGEERCGKGAGLVAPAPFPGCLEWVAAGSPHPLKGGGPARTLSGQGTSPLLNPTLDTHHTHRRLFHHGC